MDDVYGWQGDKEIASLFIGRLQLRLEPFCFVPNQLVAHAGPVVRWCGALIMKRIVTVLLMLWVSAFWMTSGLAAQDARPPADAAAKPAPVPEGEKDAKAVSGMYTFLKEGEFVQITVEDEGRVTGFISRYGDGDSDKGAFLDQFFKTGKLEGSKLAFTTELVHGVGFDFKGSVERGEGKNPGDDAYFVIKGTLTENVSDVNKKVTSHSRDVIFKLFPQDASPSPDVRQ